MIFAPHILQVKVITPMEKDEFGRPIPGTGGESWQDVCKCRCDDVSAEKKVSINGVLYDFKYKVVFDKPSKVEVGTEVRCLNADGSIRGEGVAKSPLETNYFLIGRYGWSRCRLFRCRFFFDEGEWEVEKKMIDVGDEAVKYAEEHGDYQDHTLTLRTSNDYDVDKSGLTLKNEAEYASFVESKGFDVLSGAALYAEKRLKEEFE